FFGVAHHQRFADRMTLQAIRDFNATTEHIVAGWRDMDADTPKREDFRTSWLRRRAEGKERVRIWRAAEQQRLQTIDTSGFEEAKATSEAALDHLDEIEDKSLETPARSLSGIAVKLRVMRRLAGNDSMADIDFDWEHQFGIAALRDAERLMDQVEA